MNREYTRFVSAHPRLIQALSYWAGKRHKHPNSSVLAYAGMKQVFHDLSEEVEAYITELILDDLRFNASYIHKWQWRLSKQEKAAIAKLFPSTETELCRLTDPVWYELGGEYQVIDEPIVEEFAHEGNQIGLITVNSYDAKILNANNLMIVDVDLPTNCEFSQNLGHIIAYSKKQALSVLKLFCQENTDYGFRVYATRAGLRYICTTHRAYPHHESTKQIFRCLYADPLYVQLCQFQGTFRARLSPKPWRVGNAEETSRWTYDRNQGYVTPQGRQWEEVRVCKALGIVGKKHILEEFKLIIKHHDEITQALNRQDIPLA